MIQTNTQNKLVYNFTSPKLFSIVKINLNNITEDKNYYYTNDIKKWYAEWDFKKFDPNIYSHGFHQYPAKFIPQLARKLLRIFTDEKSCILDNFSGSGTTLIECLLLNRKKVIGIELNPFACFMTRVKITPIHPKRIIDCLSEIEQKYHSNSFKYIKSNFYNIDFWFKTETIEELSKLKEIIVNIQDIDIKNFFLLTLSYVTRKVSLTDHNGFKLHRDKNKLDKNFNPDVYSEFKKMYYHNISLMGLFYEKAKNSKTQIEIICGDSRISQNIENGSIDFILSSPPYGDSRTTVAYGQFSRLPWQLINNDSEIYLLDEKLLGGKNGVDFNNEILEYSRILKEQVKLIKNSCEKRAKDVLSFYIDLFKCLKNAYNYLKKDKYYVLVTGNRTVKNVFLRTDLIISEISEKIGFKTEKILYRNIINKRMPSKNSPTNEKGKLSNTMLKENIVFLRKI